MLKKLLIIQLITFVAINAMERFLEEHKKIIKDWEKKNSNEINTEMLDQLKNAERICLHLNNVLKIGSIPTSINGDIQFIHLIYQCAQKNGFEQVMEFLNNKYLKTSK